MGRCPNESSVGRRAGQSGSGEPAGGGPGAPGPAVRGSTLFLGAGGRNYSHPRFINSAAPEPVRVRQRYPCPSTYPSPPATAHPPPSPWEGDGRPRRWLRPASPRMPSAASIFLLPAPASSLRASRTLPRRAGVAPTRLPLPARRCPPTSLRAPFYPFQSLPDFHGLVASFAACCGFIFEKDGIYLQGHRNGLNRAELTHH